VSDTHQAGPRTQIKAAAIVLGGFTVIGVALWPLGIPLVLIGAMVGWVVLGVYAILAFGVIEPAGDAIGRILVPSGGSTPPAKGLSHIEAMEARGDYAGAAAAYRHEIETDPADVTSCARLGLLARRDLRDGELALFAYREGEKRAAEPRRKLGFALLALEVYRDQRDAGRAIVELGRILRSYPDASNAAELRAELAELKAQHFEES
jgi:tetratricopeptide (TPR) repeat protein